MRSLLCWCFLLITMSAEAQSVLNDKSFYDTLLPVKTFLRAALYRHHYEGNARISEADFFPELNAAFMYDESRGLNGRASVGAGITYSMHRLKFGRLKIGTGLSVEHESWRIFERKFLPQYDTLSPALKDFLSRFFGINCKGNIEKTNFRWSSYVQFVCIVAGKVELSAVGQVQVPLRPNFDGMLNSPLFPTTGKKYARLTADLSATLNISRHLSFFLKYFIQKDEGQLSPFAKEEVSNFSQGLTYHF